MTKKRFTYILGTLIIIAIFIIILFTIRLENPGQLYPGDDPVITGCTDPEVYRILCFGDIPADLAICESEGASGNFYRFVPE